MVVLRIVFEDFGLLFVVEVADEVIYSAGELLVLEIASPFFGVEEPVEGRVVSRCFTGCGGGEGADGLLRAERTSAWTIGRRTSALVRTVATPKDSISTVVRSMIMSRREPTIVNVSNLSLQPACSSIMRN